MIAIIVVVAVVMTPSRASPAPADAPVRLWQRRSALDTNPTDVQEARRLHRQHPRLSRAELAARIPLTDLQRDLIAWMRDDLVAYVAEHDAVWEKRLRARPDLLQVAWPPGSPLPPLRRDREAAGAALAQFDRALAPEAAPPLTLRDLFYLVSVFVLPDETGDGRRLLDLADDACVMSAAARWPELGLVFTTQALGFRRLSLRYNQPTQYLGLISHQAPARVHNQVVYPSEFLLHDSSHARETFCYEMFPGATRWDDIHQTYRRRFPMTAPDARLCDLVYFIRTHEEAASDDADEVYRLATSPIELQWVKRYASEMNDGGGEDWDQALRDAIRRVSEFLRKEHPASGSLRLDRDAFTEVTLPRPDPAVV